MSKFVVDLYEQEAMTNAASSGHKRTAARAVIFFAVIALAAGAAVLMLNASRQKVSLTILDYTTNRWSRENFSSDEDRTYVSATIAMTNHTSRSITYSAYIRPQLVQYSVLRRTASGWEKRIRWTGCGLGITEYILPPSRGLHFEAMVDRTQPCKVAVYYTDGRMPSAVWNRLPAWLAQRLAWLRTPPRAITAEINLARTQ